MTDWDADKFVQEVADTLTGFKYVRKSDRKEAIERVVYELIQEWATDELDALELEDEQRKERRKPRKKP
mgnify:CR=1 FL=1